MSFTRRRRVGEPPATCCRCGGARPSCRRCRSWAKWSMNARSSTEPCWIVPVRSGAPLYAGADYVGGGAPSRRRNRSSRPAQRRRARAASECRPLPQPMSRKVLALQVAQLQHPGRMCCFEISTRSSEKCGGGRRRPSSRRNLKAARRRNRSTAGEPGSISLRDSCSWVDPVQPQRFARPCARPRTGVATNRRTLRGHPRAQ